MHILQDCVMDTGLRETAIRKQSYDRTKTARRLQVGDRVLCRIPGITSKLENSWEGPYTEQESVGEVNYKLCRDDRKHRKPKVVHINNVKTYVERDQFIGSVMVVTEETDFETSRKILVDAESTDIDREKLKDMLEGFPDALTDKPGCCAELTMDIRLEEGAQPFVLSPYTIPEKLKAGVQQEIEELVNSGIIEESNIEWSFPLVPVTKPNGSVRLCVDYRHLNNLTPQVQYQKPSLDDILAKAGEAKIMSKLDLAKGFYQLTVEPGSRDKVTFCSPFGKYQFKHMPFGLKNAPVHFQRMVEKALRGCR